MPADSKKPIHSRFDSDSYPSSPIPISNIHLQAQHSNNLCDLLDQEIVQLDQP